MFMPDNTYNPVDDELLEQGYHLQGDEAIPRDRHYQTPLPPLELIPLRGRELILLSDGQ